MTYSRLEKERVLIMICKMTPYNLAAIVVWPHLCLVLSNNTGPSVPL